MYKIKEKETPEKIYIFKKYIIKNRQLLYTILLYYYYREDCWDKENNREKH